MSNLKSRAIALLDDLGIASPDLVRAVTPLTGGVASDIARVETREGDYCVKFALAKLRVEADWQAPLHRNSAEYHWLELAFSLFPGNSPRLYGRSDKEHGFVMEFVSEKTSYLWKSAMLAGEEPKGEAAKLGDMLGQIHKASSKPDFDRAPFANQDDFAALRLEPYLAFTATKHPELGDMINAMATRLYKADKVLVHGDVSPKNIIIRETGPVILDAECASMGDASFDPAFCLNHLCLKALHVPQIRRGLLGALGSFWKAYLAHIDWEDTSLLETRILELLPMLMLARIDGKSPVEYLDDENRDWVRDFAMGAIQAPTTSMGEFITEFEHKLELKEDG